MHTGDLCFFTGASLFIVGVVGYFFTGAYYREGDR